VVFSTPFLQQFFEISGTLSWSDGSLICFVSFVGYVVVQGAVAFFVRQPTLVLAGSDKK
jgi:hypothetical protein